MYGGETEKMVDKLYSWSIAVYCVGEVGMVRHDSWMTLRAFEESLFSITVLSVSDTRKREDIPQEILISLAP